MNEFTKIFNSIAYRHEFMRVFDDFLTLSICAFSFGRMENLYLETIEGYCPDEVNLFGKLLGALILDYEKKSNYCGAWGDGLGDFFMENNNRFGQDARGQFFTPEPVCDMIASMTAGNEVRENNNVLDPAAGSGRMLLAFDRRKTGNRLKNFYVACDIDPRCVKMCALNFFLYGLKGAVIHMDSLKMDAWGGYRIFMPETGLGIQSLTKDECLQFIVSPPENKNEQPVESFPAINIQDLVPEKALQLTLF